MRMGSSRLWALCFASTMASCALIVNPDLEGLEAYTSETGAPDAETGGEALGKDADADADDVRDADASPDNAPDADAALDGPDAADTADGATPDGSEAGVLITGSFVASSVVPAQASQYQIVGQMVSTTRVRGTTKSGFLVEGWLQ
jgi:hypothetical protein